MYTEGTDVKKRTLIFIPRNFMSQKKIPVERTEI